jgi:hypothetical protein
MVHGSLDLTIPHKASFFAESSFNFASYNDEAQRERDGNHAPYSGKSLHLQSHGQSFLNLFIHRFRNRKPVLYLLDEQRNDSFACHAEGHMEEIRFWSDKRQGFSYLLTTKRVLWITVVVPS